MASTVTDTVTVTVHAVLKPTNLCGYCPDSGLDFYDPSQHCDAAAEFLVAMLGNKSPNMKSLIEYLRSFGGSSVPEWRAMDWFFCARDCETNKMTEKLIDIPREKCGKQICAVWEWDGNADIVGVGMMVVYTMGAILSTLYLFIFIHGMLRENNYKSFRAPQLLPRGGVLNTIRNTFYHSFGAFHAGLGLLTASVLLATVIIAGKRESVYDIETSFLCSATLTAMFFLTLPAYLDVERRYGSGIVFGFANWLLFTISMSMKDAAAVEAKRVKENQPWSFEAFCWDKQVSDEIAAATVLVLYTIPLVVLLLAGLNAAIGKCLKRPKETVPVLGWLLFRVPWRLVYAVYFFVFMWASLGSLFRLKSEISKINDGGETKSEDRWGFGQILAVATWLPVLEEAFMITYSHPRKAFGIAMRADHFTFADVYRPLNHGSFGACTRLVNEYQRQLQSESEARPDTFIRYTYLKVLQESRAAIAPLLGARPGEVVFIPNATTGVNTVFRNMSFGQGDVVLHFGTIYGACEKTIQSLSEICPVTGHSIDMTYPIDDEEIIARFRAAVKEVQAQGKRAKLAMFDTVLTFLGARFPWEALVGTCRELGILSFVDGAHGVGHIDLTHLGQVEPDFLVSNCYKWLMVPRGCAVLYVPFRNQGLVSTSIPTSWGYETKEERAKMSPQDYFSRLFDKVSTTDNTPYCCIPLALEFRATVCGGETNIRTYCEDLARRGGERMAEMLGTACVGDPSSAFRRCCFVNVRLPLALVELDIDADSGSKVAKWMQERTPAEYETNLPIKFYAREFWCRVISQIYLTMDEFEWAAKTLHQLCERVRAGEWR
ncbi:hypothetical protein ACHAQH_000354 [Verticillium albo-atrum]